MTEVGRESERDIAMRERSVAALVFTDDSEQPPGVLTPGSRCPTRPSIGELPATDDRGELPSPAAAHPGVRASPARAWP